MSLFLRDVAVVPEGDGVEVSRLFPIADFMNFDPFVLWDHFSIGPGRGFPDHPHRGFEAITYMFNGGMNHKDNLGNESYVISGGAQRFTAGRGMVHSEMPSEVGESDGIQLWINLPKRLKQIEPGYQQVDAAQFPVNTFDGGEVKVLVGENSPLKLNSDVIYQHVKLNADTNYSLLLNAGMRGLVYLKSGAVNINNVNCETGQAMFIEEEQELSFTAVSDTEFMICMGLPHGEPIRQYGPFVD